MTRSLTRYLIVGFLSLAAWTLEAGASLSVSPAQISVAGTAGLSSFPQAVRISTSSGTVNWAVSFATLNGTGWLGFQHPGSGTVTPEQSGTLTVIVSVRNLVPGFYQGTVTIRDVNTGEAVTIPVTATASAPSGRLRLVQSSYVFRTAEGRPFQRAFLRVSNFGSAPLTWSVPANPAPWLTISPSSGTVNPGALVPSQADITTNPAFLPVGVHQVVVPVSAPGAGDSPQLVTVTVHVVPANTPPTGEISPTAITIPATQGGPPPLTYGFSIDNVGSGNLTFTLQATTFSGGNWLVPGATSGNASIRFPMIINANVAGLSPGTYRGKVTVTFSTGSVQEVDVLLVIAPAASITAQRELPQAAACASASMDFVLTTIGSGTSLPVSFPRTLLAEVVDNCGAAVNGATLVVSVDGRSIVLGGVGSGLYSGDWTPERQTAAVPVAVVAVHPSYPTVQRGFTVSTSAAVGGIVLPVLSPDGVVEGAGFTSLRPLAPGGIISVFGSRFAAGDNSAAVVPLPRSLGGVSVRIGNEDAPLYYAGAGQINAQVPVSVRTGENVSIVVSTGGRITTPQSYPIAPAQPGVFKSGEFAAVLDSQFRVINASNPARIGDTLQIFATGLGLTDPPAATGEFSPSFSTVQNPVTVTIGGVQMPVAYQGLAPGFVGLYQINVVLTGIAPGTHAVVLQQNGVASNPTLPVSIPVQ